MKLDSKCINMHLQCIYMARKMTSMRIEEELLRKAKKHGINVSAFLDIELRKYIALIEGKLGNNPSKDLINTNHLTPLRARSLDWIGRQPPKL